MSLKFKMEYLRSIYDRYQKASKEQKGQIVEEFCKVCKYHRKHAIRLLNAPKPENKTKVTRQRCPRYGIQVIQILEAIWKASGYLCSQRLKEALPIWIPFARKRFDVTPKMENQLISISPRQIDNRLREKKRSLKRRIYHTTRPGSLLKSMIPIRTHSWNIRLPGFLELDLVAHCGNSLAGSFLYTLNATDILTGWTERVAVMGKGQDGVLKAIQRIKDSLPCRLRGIDSDNGEEFINYHLLHFCIRSKPRIQFTRSRPYKKDDNAHIEQKNWTHVRQIFGWQRYDTESAQSAMNDLYIHELRLFQNLFQPSMKLLRKTRVGSRLIRKYDAPKTPFQRLLTSHKGHRAKVKELKSLLQSIDPFELSQRIDHLLSKIYPMASKSPPPLWGPRRLSDVYISRKKARRIRIMGRAITQNFKEAA